MKETTVTRSYEKTAKLVLCALFAAIMAVSAGLAIPVPGTPVPISLGTLAVMITAGLLGGRWGFASVMVYLLLGACGAPVFGGYTGGLGILMGPTGGYLAGYALTALVAGSIIEKLNKNDRFFVNVLAMVVGLLFCYLLGTLWFIHLTGMGIGAAMAACVLPFLPGEVVKILAASALTKKLRVRISKIGGR